MSKKKEKVKWNGYDEKHQFKIISQFSLLFNEKVSIV